MKTAEVRAIFAEIKAELVPLIAELRDREVDDSFLTGDFPLDKQVALDHEIVDLFGHRPDAWRIDPTEHPFASGAGIDDIRITTHYYADALKSLFSTMHEYGHGLYQHQLPERDRAPADRLRRLARHPRVAEPALGEPRRPQPAVLALLLPARCRRRSPSSSAASSSSASTRRSTASQPSLIRIRADEVTYGMHVILRFELEQDIVNGRVELRDLPQRWTEKMHEYLGVEVPDDAHGVLQDMHWSVGLIGYFSTYLLGTVMSVQIWEKARRRHRRPRGADRARRVRGAARVARRARARARAQVHAAGDAATSDRLDDRREAVPRVPEEEVRRARPRLNRPATLPDPAP